MRAVGAARWFLSSASIVALAAVFAPERAYAACPGNHPGEGIIANSGDICSAAGSYTGLPVAPVGVGFFAAPGGEIGATGVTSISITTPNSGVEANGGVISLTNDFTSVNTTGASAYGFYAQSGGQITLGATLPGLVRVLTGGSDAFGLYATGASSNITVDSVAVILTAGTGADGVVADAGGIVSLASGGQVTTGYNTSSAAVGVLAETGGQVSR